MTFRPLQSAVLAVMMAAAACKQDPPPAKPAAPSTEKPTQAAAPAAKPRKTKRMWMVPHPSEIMEIMRSMGLAKKAAELAPIVDVDFKPMDGQRVAFNTGVLVADLVLSLESASGQDLSTRLGTIRKGLTELGMGADQIADLDKLSRRLSSGKMSAEELAGELDVLQGKLMDEVSSYSSPDALVGIQAGAWVRAVNVVSSLLIQTGKAAEGAHLFAQPELVDYFMNYLKKNEDKAVENPALEKSMPYLTQLKTIATKEDLTADDVTAVQKATSAILTQFSAVGSRK